MKKHLVVAVLALAMAVPAVSHAAMDMSGKWGVGYFRPEAPIGVRIWAGEQVAIDLGVGFHNTSPDQGDSRTAFIFEGGLPWVLHSSDNALFFFRPGAGFSSNGGKDDATTLGGAQVTSFFVSGSLGAEYFFTPNFSVQAAHGILWQSINTKFAPPTPAPKVDATDTFIDSEDFGISSIGFHYYFGGK